MELKLLTKKENQIMSILWHNEEALTAHQITEINPDLSIYTVQQVLQRLLKMEYIRIDQINYSGTVLARFYTPNITKAEYMKFLFGEKSTFELASNLIETSTNEKELEALEELIKKQISSIKG